MNAGSVRIVIAEDEPAHVEAIRRALFRAGAGWEVREASSLADFRREVAQSAPDLAIVDYLLPDGQGDSVLVSPAEDGAFPVLLMTSHGDETTAVNAIRKGALDYIVKSPEAFAEMPHAVNRALQSWRVLVERRDSQRALRESEQLLRDMGRAAQVGGWEFETATGEGRWTEEVARIHDLDPAMPPNKGVGLSFYPGGLARSH